MFLADPFDRGEVRDRPRHLEHAIVGAGAERQPLGGRREQAGAGCAECSPAGEATSVEIGVDPRRAARVPVGLDRSRRFDPRPDT